MIKPMQTAIGKGDLKATGKLVDQGFQLDELLFDGNNSTALHIAVDLRRYKIIELLLTAGANPDIRNDQFKETPIHRACHEGDLVAVDLLVRGGADANVYDDTGISPLMLASEAPKKALQIVEILIESGASVKNNKNGRNPLHSKISDPAIVDQLSQAGADINGSFYGITPLIKAMENFFLCKVDPASRSYNKPNAKVVAAYIANGADPTVCFPREMRYGADAKGQPLIEYARQKKLTATILKILESGKGPNGLKESIQEKKTVRK